jgi:hypothetical protein
MRAFTAPAFAATDATNLGAVMLDPRQAERLERRAAAKRARVRERQVVAALAAALLVVIAILIATTGMDKRTARPAAPARTVETPAPIVPGGPIAPASVGGLAALWAPQNVVAEQPGTATAYARASRLAGLPGYLLIADRGYNDDTFVEPGGRALIANEEDNHAIVEIGFAPHSLRLLFGHPGRSGADATHLNTPDDAYSLPDGSFTVADAYNCRILFVRGGAIARQLGHSGVCHHNPPSSFGPVNGDTPEPGGGVIVSEIPGSWIDGISANGTVQFAFRAPIAYPSDPQPLPGGRILLADYSNPGHVLITNRAGKVLWRYGPTQGYGRMDHPSLAMALPNGDIAVNDDYRNRVIVIDPRRRRIVWQYGHTDVPGTAPGYLNTPDGMDVLPAGAGGAPAYGAVVHP